MKICSVCKKEKDLFEFHRCKSAKDGLQWRCKACQKEVDKKYRSRRNASSKEYYGKHKGDFLRRQIFSRQRMKKEVLDYYSQGNAKCMKCGENDLVVLCLDHIHNNGSYERKTLGFKGGYDTYRRLKRLGYPKGYQVLCYNCNIRKYFESINKEFI